MTARPLLLDLFCGAGGAAVGYARAGFDVVGVDISPQPHYAGCQFHQADALTFLADLASTGCAITAMGRKLHLADLEAIHASPPCQRYSTMTKRWARSGEHPDLVGSTRALLAAIGLPFVIENVVGAPLVGATMLCGSMFSLGSQGYGLRRHRLFEPHGFEVWPPASCAHVGPALPVYGHAGGKSTRDGLTFPGTAAWRQGMGIDWMTGAELSQAIPPAYTEFIGEHMFAALAGPAEVRPDRESRAPRRLPTLGLVG